LNSGRIEQIGTPYDVYNKPTTEYVATFLGSANILTGIIRGQTFQSEEISLDIGDEYDFTDGQPAKLVIRPEDVFLRRPENLMQNYQRLTEGLVEEMSFVGAFERVGVRLSSHGRQAIVVTRPKTETSAFHLEPGQKVTIGVVRFRILADLSQPSMRANRAG
jgi:ABC-type Fe3+/spermidine/putrescine transport system ATPase subunit